MLQLAAIFLLTGWRQGGLSSAEKSPVLCPCTCSSGERGLLGSSSWRDPSFPPPGWTEKKCAPTEGRVQRGRSLALFSGPGGHGHALRRRRVPLNRRERVFYWEGCPRRLWTLRLWRQVKSSLDVARDKRLGVALLEHGLGSGHLQMGSCEEPCGG